MTNRTALCVALGVSACASACGRGAVFSGKNSSSSAASTAAPQAPAPGAVPDAAEHPAVPASTTTDSSDATADKTSDVSKDGAAAKTKNGVDEDILSVGPDLSKITAEQLAAACGDAKLLKSKIQAVDFPKPATTCDWGKDGNLPFDRRNQLIFTARRQQDQALSLPAGAVVCSVDFTFSEAKIRYDDEILLVYGGIVLMSSQELARPGELQIDAAGLTHWDWANLLKRRYEIDRRDQYFIDQDCGGDCELPPTETTGTVRLKVKPDTMQKITLGAAKAKSGLPAFSFVTLGDNDPETDCLHEDFKFSVKLGYVQTSAAK